jgi:hypothetical protein
LTALGPWELVGRSLRLPFFSNEGLATVDGPSGRRRLLFRGGWSVPWRLLIGRTWTHVGDPDSRQGIVIDCYQAKGPAAGKMYRTTAPDGQTRDYVHRLSPGEQLNNSFVAVTPDGQWMVSGEWNTMSRFLIFPTPQLNAQARGGSALELAGVLELDHPVRNVQGAVFVDPVTLVCSTDDAQTDLWPVSRQLLQVQLERPLDGSTVRAHVSCLGALPLRSCCAGTFEVEGIDYDMTTGDLRVVIIPPAPCKWASVAVYQFRRPGSPSAFDRRRSL